MASAAAEDKMMKNFALAGLLLWLAIAPSFAAGPETIAKSDRSLWPDPIDSAAGYDRASRAEILVFVNALVDTTARDDDALKDQLRIKSIDRASVTHVRDRLLARLLENYRAAAAGCAADEAFCAPVAGSSALIEASRTLPGHLPEKYRAWFANADTFHHQYAGELVRLAALFPKVTSEIDTFGPQERTGLELPDGHFLLTFDDGPTAAGGTTDALLPALADQRLHGLFFTLGERLQKRLQSDGAASVARLYQGQCVALHGWAHESHQRWDQWQSSILNAQQLVKDNLAADYRPYFRPPYGQRRADSGPFFADHKLSVVLWNIDSQDWNAHVSEHEAAQRVLTLMLLWRRGVILFHDVHAKAAQAIPWIVGQTKHAAVTWEDCHQY
jgi:peptidoglycan/xylan/chitin deacetylase (PgdA/CDA1 family)